MTRRFPKTIAGRVPEDLHKAIRFHAVDIDSTVQDYILGLIVSDLASKGLYKGDLVKHDNENNE